MAAIAFEKWEGLGNDFVVIEVASPAGFLAPETVRAICDRRRGVGADGVLFVERAAAGRAARMTVFNADGSRPEMCGNGLRCVAAYLVTPNTSSRFDVVTDDGAKACAVTRAEEQAEVEVDMGRASVEPELVVELDGVAQRFLRMSTGNPHAITFDQVAQPALERVGRHVEQAVAGGANVEFAQLSATGIDVVVWERGVGFTQACGTGACAVAAAACQTERAKFGEPIAVLLPGGKLTITVEQGSLAIRMRGPARRAFSGVWSG